MAIGTDTASSTTSRRRGHIGSSTRRLPEPSTNEGWYSTSVGAPAASAACSAAPVAGSAVRIRVCGERARMALAIPTVRPAAPERDDDGVDVGEVLENLEPDRSVARHHRLVLDRVHEQPLDAGHRRGDDRLPPLVVGHLDHPATEALDCVELGLWGVVGDGDRRRQPELSRHPGDALGHVARAGGDQPAAPCLRVRAADRVARPADLERADGLQGLELEIDLGRRVVDGQAHERGAHDEVGDPLAGGLDVGQRDHSATSTPRRRRRAPATAN